VHKENSHVRICGVDEAGQVAVERSLKRCDVVEFFANLPPCVVAMEAGSGTHYWARELTGPGHEARIIDPRLVARYRQEGRAGKNDTNDAAAICEAAGRPKMRLVPVNSAEQQAVLVVHGLRNAQCRTTSRLARHPR
jgi:transposase